MTDASADSDRERFRQISTGAVNAARSTEPDQAAAEAGSAEQLAERWRQAGQLTAFLTPLLDDRDARVRFGAAAILLKNSERDLAVPALTSLTEATEPVASDARILLESWEQEQARKGD